MNANIKVAFKIDIARTLNFSRLIMVDSLRSFVVLGNCDKTKIETYHDYQLKLQNISTKLNRSQAVHSLISDTGVTFPPSKTTTTEIARIQGVTARE